MVDGRLIGVSKNSSDVPQVKINETTDQWFTQIVWTIICFSVIWNRFQLTIE